MEPRTTANPIVRLLRSILLTDLVLSGIAVALAWLAGWRTPGGYADALAVCGLGAVLIGTLSVLGHWGGTRSFPYVFGRSMSPAPLPERTRQGLSDLADVYSLAILMVISVAIAMAAGGLLSPAVR